MNTKSFDGEMCVGTPARKTRRAIRHTWPRALPIPDALRSRGNASTQNRPRAGEAFSQEPGGPSNPERHGCWGLGNEGVTKSHRRPKTKPRRARARRTGRAENRRG